MARPTREPPKGIKQARGRTTTRYRRRRSRSSTRCGSRRRRTRSKSAYSSYSEFRIPLRVPQNLQDVKFDLYIKRLQKKVRPRMKMKKQSVELMNNLIKDALHQIATHAAAKMGRRKTLKPAQLKRGLRGVLPRTLMKRVDEHAQKAVDRYARRTRR